MGTSRNRIINREDVKMKEIKIKYFSNDYEKLERIEVRSQIG